MKASDTGNLSLLRGILYLDRHSGGLRTGYEDLGECDQFDYEEPEISEVEQYTARDASGGKTKGTVTKFKPQFTIRGRELATFNLALQAMGLELDFNQASGSRSDYALPEAVAIKLGKSYFLPEQNISALVVKKTAGAVTLTPGTDYTVDLVASRVYFLPTAAAITDGDGALFSYTYPVITRKAVSPGAVKRVDASLRYIGDSADGQKFNLEIFHSQIKPSGVLPFLQPPDANEYAPWSIKGDVLSDGVGLFGGSSTYKFARWIPTGTVTSS